MGDYRVNLSDGRTLSFELSDEEDRAEWAKAEQDSELQDSIRGATLLGEVRSVVVTKPRRFDSSAWSARVVTGKDGEKVGEKIEIQSDDVRVEITRYFSGMVRIDLKRTGTPRFLAIPPDSET